MLGLWLNAERSELRQSLRIVNGVKAAFSAELPVEWFEAMYESPDEAKAEHAVHLDRVRSQAAAASLARHARFSRN